MKVSKDLIIVTGGSGFIGSNIVKALNEAGQENILIVDRLGKADKWKNLVDLKFLDYEHKDDFLVKLERGMFDHGIWAVFHMGACSSTTEKDRGLPHGKQLLVFPQAGHEVRGEKGAAFYLRIQCGHVRGRGARVFRCARVHAVSTPVEHVRLLEADF